MKFEWKGVFPAVTTKFGTDDQLDLKAFDHNLQAQLDAGVDGIILGGSLGEASTLTDDEKDELVKFTVQSVKTRVPVIMNVAEQATGAPQRQPFARKRTVQMALCCCRPCAMPPTMRRPCTSSGR